MSARLMGILLFAGISAAAFANDAEADERNMEQTRLDAACESARQLALEPRRQDILTECVEKFKKDASTCVAEASAYNGSRVGRSPLYYDLPACEVAFNYRKSGN